MRSACLVFCFYMATASAAFAQVKIDWNLAKPSPDFGQGMADAYRQGQAMAAERQRQQQALVEQQRRDQAYEAQRQAYASQSQANADRVALAKQMGGLIAQGLCDEAKNLALKAGEFDMAERSIHLCTATR